MRCRLTAIDPTNPDRHAFREDGAPFTETEPLKGAFSSALKRAAVQFGVGRYLYELDSVFLRLEDRHYETSAHKDKIKIKSITPAGRTALKDAYRHGLMRIKETHDLRKKYRKEPEAQNGNQADSSSQPGV
ncbi:Rad52/Rad22 family DNA repair protein [Sulfidibacter corallicola]|uniref:Uncharacterized protein n=1 Tax=Sulfidibacter corallicola TaxID=2818388 RepID=A0A8A4TMN5_SULCO|nr:hypothetical protein J3U87_34455 [Sulfidibacter corallicola]